MPSDADCGVSGIGLVKDAPVSIPCASHWSGPFVEPAMIGLFGMVS